MTEIPTPTDPQALADRLFAAALGALELFSVHVGWRLGLYRPLAERPHTTAELALAAGIDERYAQEWLEQQATAGFLVVDDPAAPADARRFHVPEANVPALLDAEDPRHMVPLAPMLAGIAGALPEVVEAYRTGAGVPYARYGADFRDGQGAINRPTFVHDLPGWIAAMPDVADRLRAGGAVADLGCGQGWSTIALARAFPGAAVVGIDSDTASVADARAHAAAAGAEVTVTDADAGLLDGAYDLVCTFEALHDLADPVGVLAAARKALAPGGAVLVVDERVPEAFSGAGDEVERCMYGWSVLHCLPACRTETPSAALGTVLREGTVARLAGDAGFASTTVLDIEHDAFRLYRLDP